MYRRVRYVMCGLHLLCTSYFVSVSFGSVIQHKTTQEFQNKINSTEMNKNKTVGVQSLQSTRNTISPHELISTTISNDSQDMKDLDTETEVNLDNVRKKLNEEDLYEYVTEKNNVSQRSFVFIPASKYKIPFVSPLARPQKTKQNAYDKTFISNTDDLADAPFDDFSLRFDGFTGKKPDHLTKGIVDDAIPIKKVAATENKFFKQILGNSIEEEMDSLTNKVKAANGIIHMQYKNVNNDLLHIERQFADIKSEKQKGYFKDEEMKMFEFTKPHKNTHDHQIKKALFDVVDNTQTFKKYATKQTNDDRINLNITQVNANDGNVLSDRYDYVELMKQKLLRPTDNKKPENGKNILFKTLKAKMPLQVNPFKHKGNPVLGYNNLLPESHNSQQFDSSRNEVNLNFIPLETVTFGFDNQNPNNIFFNNIIKAEPLDSNPFRKDISSSNEKAYTLKSEHNLNVSNLHTNMQESDKPFGNFQSQNYDFSTYGHNSKTASLKQSSVTPPEATSSYPIIQSYYNVKQPYQTRLFGHDSLSSKANSRSDIKMIGREMYNKNNYPVDHPKQKENTYHKTFKNDIAPYGIVNKLKNPKIMSTNFEDEPFDETENYAPIQHIRFHPEESEEPDFHNSLLAKKVQEIKELGKQFSDESADADSNREINTRKYVKNSSQEQKNRKVKSRPKIRTKAECVYPDCEMRRQKHKHLKVKHHTDKCDCDVNKHAPKMNISHSGEITPVVINASTDFEIK